ncbi:HET-domain-containing protein [Melanomma pulvis-pyrius CBS 109.77]|uniref:HET-domain-containing protein n=1 Tax=Melanomma pulvis-pyrius CBS 109.77 TaxID=1314802 RepID=A0A6A6X5B2_9PLEO|nr:HET-domain-containing protein [Melanomma pulvis-pyrius CBS 109.77]
MWKVSRWPTCCDMDHEGVCHTLPAWKTLPHSSSLILVDVDSWRLVSVEPKQYVALSYVWGRILDILETTKANFEVLQQPGALASPGVSSRLPRTVHDAIVLTKAMNQRYLWVDRLCIVQDDYENKKAQLDRMASIYTRSYFTIVAADGSDADHGLRGVPGTALSRNYEENKYRFSEQCTMMQAPIPEDKLDTKDWHRRGWTFQERVLSNRNLIFFHDQVFWECRSSLWVEAIADIAEGANPLKISKRKGGDRHDLQFSKWPDLHQYANLVQRYNSRLLSFDSDALYAFSAVLQVLSRSFPCGFLHGLPEFFFDFALLWAPVFPQKRRAHRFPSWSWLSHEGDMSFLYYNKCDECVFKAGVGSHIRVPPGVELAPLVEWYKTSATSGDKVRIGNAYAAHQTARRDPTLALPPGWESRIHRQTHANLRSDQEAVVYFLNDKAWGTAFIYPVPLADEPLQTMEDSWGPNLSFRTARRFLVGGPAVVGHVESGGHGWSSHRDAEAAGCLTFSLHDAAGDWVGVMRSNAADERDIPLAETCEVVLLSSGVAHDDPWHTTRLQFAELLVRDELRDVVVYEFFNVMWIKREGDVAFRLGVGRVWKEAWERGLSERVDVVLG